jgi:N-methylhydantoinase B
VLRDVSWGKVSVRGAREDYGVVLTPDGTAVDTDASDELRASRRAGRGADEPYFDRGPGFPALAGGRTHAEVDFL